MHRTPAILKETRCGTLLAGIASVRGPKTIEGEIMALDVNLTRNYLNVPMLQSPDATNGVTGSSPRQTLTGKKGVSNWIISPGGGSTLIGGDSGDSFFVVDPTDVVIAAPNSGI